MDARVKKAREQIISHDAQNLASLERIESAIVIISLDSKSPITREEKARGLWVGDGKDRWFDKHQRKPTAFRCRSFPRFPVY